MDEDVRPAEAVEALFRQYKDEVYRHALFVLANPSEAEDAVSEVFLRMLRAWPQFRHEAKPKTWLHTIVRNYLTDVLRERKKQREHFERHPEKIENVHVHMSQLVEWEDVLKQLNLESRQVVYCRMIQGYSTEETADMLGWSKVKVRVLLHRAKRTMRALLTDDHPELSEGDSHAPHGT